jgi:hypothetical protein
LHLGRVWLSTCTTTHSTHHTHGLFHHFWVVHHLFDHWVVHHLCHIAHIRHLLPIELLRSHLRRHLRLHSWSLWDVLGLILLGLALTMSVLSFLRAFNHIRIVFCHFGALSDRVRGQVRHHLLKLIVSERHSMEGLVLLTHHGGVGLHHVNHVANLIVAHRVDHVNVLTYVSVTRYNLRLCNRLCSAWLWGLLHFFNGWLVIADLNSRKKFVFCLSGLGLFFGLLSDKLGDCVMFHFNFIEKCFDRLITLKALMGFSDVFKRAFNLRVRVARLHAPDCRRHPKLALAVVGLLF